MDTNPLNEKTISLSKFLSFFLLLPHIRLVAVSCASELGEVRDEVSIIPDAYGDSNLKRCMFVEVQQILFNSVRA